MSSPPSSAASAATSAADLLDSPEVGGTAIRGGSLRLLGYAISVAVSVGSSALLLRHLGVVDTGRYVTVMAVVSLAVGITEGGLNSVGVRELSTLPAEHLRRFFASLSGLRILFVLGGVLFSVAFSVLSGYPSTMVLGCLLAGGVFLLSSIQTSYELPLLAQMRLATVTLLEMLRQIGGALVTVALVLAGASLLPFWAVAAPSALLAVLLSGALIHGSFPLRPAFDPAIWRSLVRRTLPYSLASAVGVIYFRLAILIMSHAASATQTGYYGASFRIVEVLFVVPQLIVGSTLPIFARAARDDRGRLEYALGKTLEICLLLGLATGLALLAGAQLIIAVVAGPRFAPADPVLRIQGLALIATFVGAVLSYALLSLARYRDVLSINLSVLLLSGILTTILASRHGAVGAALATTTVEFLYTAMMAVAVVRAGIRPQIKALSIARAVLAAGLGALTLLVPPGTPSVLRPVLALAVYALALLAMRALPAEILEQIPRLPRRA